LQVSPAALDGLRVAGRVLAVRLADGPWLYPAGQFTQAGVIPLLPELLRTDKSSWSALSWLVAPTEVLRGRSALEVLREGEADGVATVEQMIAQMEIDAYG
jgi:hypothetical protein